MPEATLSPYEPSWRDRARWGLEDLLSGFGASRGTAQRYGDQLIGSPSYQGIPAADLVPWVGNAFSANEGKRAYDRGDYLGAGLGALGAVPPIPFARIGPDDLLRRLPESHQAKYGSAFAANSAVDEAMRQREHAWGGYPVNAFATHRDTYKTLLEMLDDSRHFLNDPGFADWALVDVKEHADRGSGLLRSYPVAPDPYEVLRGRGDDYLQKAASQGYDLDNMYLHGTPFQFENFDMGMVDPKDSAIFATKRPDIAASYARSPQTTTTSERMKDVGEARPNVFPFVAAPKNYMALNAANYVGNGGFPAILGEARAKGADMLEIRNLNDIGGLQSQFVVFDPGIMRSPWAAFDPSRKGKNDLLAGLGGAAALGAGAAAATMAGSSEAQAGEMDDPYAQFFAAPSKKATEPPANSPPPAGGDDPYAQFFAEPGPTPAQEPEPRSWGDTARGLGKAALAGLGDTAVGLASLPGMAERGLEWGVSKLGGLAGLPPMPDVGHTFPSSEALREHLGIVAPATDYQPQGAVEGAVRAATPFLAGAAMAPAGSIGQFAGNLAKLGAAPYAASELAGKATRGVEVGGVPIEPAARFGASLVAPSVAQGAWSRFRAPFGQIPLERQPALATVQAELGGPITPSSAHGGPILRSITDTLRNIPGGPGHRDLERDLGRFEARALERAGIGTGAPPLPGGVRPNPVLPGESPIPSQAAAFEQAYGRLERRYNLIPDARLVREARAAAQRFDQVRPSTQVGSDAGTAIARVLDQVEQAAMTGTPISGPAFGALRADIAARIQALRGSGGNNAAVNALRMQQRAVMNAMGRSIRAVNPDDATAWTDITRRYAQYAPMRRAYGPEGITPQSYAQALKSGKNAAAFAEGRLPDAEFARAALEVLPRGQQGITSGQIAKTAVTGAAYSGATPSALMFLGLPPALAHAILSPPVQRWMGGVTRAGAPVRVAPLPQGPERLPAILGALGSAVAVGRDPMQPLVVEKGDKRQTRVRVRPEAMPQ